MVRILLTRTAQIERNLPRLLRLGVGVIVVAKRDFLVDDDGASFFDEEDGAADERRLSLFLVFFGVLRGGVSSAAR